MKNAIPVLILMAAPTAVVIAASTAHVATAGVAAPQAARPGDGSAREIHIMGNYEDCTVTY
ncbi:MAG: hypothetical protein ABL994_22760, partial [Verrucomicrobiales bacterium]